MPDDILKKMEAMTARHRESFEESVHQANGRARVYAEKAVRELYRLFRDAIPSLPEVTVSEEKTTMGLPQLLCRFRRADGERYLVIRPVKYLDPRELFPDAPGGGLDPYAVLGVEIRSNTRQVQIGYLTLRLMGRTKADLQVDEPRVQWQVVHLVNEGQPEVDESLANRVIERAFVQDSYGNA